MKARVFSQPVKPVDPEQRVVLDLSVKEFAMLANLAYGHLGGNTALRKSVESGIAEAAAQLNPKNAELFRAAQHLDKYHDGWNSKRVEQVFS